MFTDEMKLTAVKREIKMRERVYPRWVAEGRMKADQAEREIAVMKAIAEDYEPEKLL